MPRPIASEAAALALTWICTLPLSVPAVTVTCAACVTVNFPVALMTHELPSALGANDSVPSGSANDQAGVTPAGATAGFPSSSTYETRAVTTWSSSRIKFDAIFLSILLARNPELNDQFPGRRSPRGPHPFALLKEPQLFFSSKSPGHFLNSVRLHFLPLTNRQCDSVDSSLPH